MKNKIGDKARLQHIFDAIQEIQSYIKNISYKKFSTNSMIQSACIKQLEIIGEAANRLSIQLRKQYPEIAWEEIIGLRNILIHEYFGIDTKIIWDIIKKDVITLNKQTKQIIKSLK